MSYYVKTVLGAVLFAGSVALFNIKLLEVLEVGTCASGGPYVSVRPCPEGTGGDILLLMASVFGGLIGAAMFAFRGRRPGSSKPNAGSGAYLAWSLFFTATGAVMLSAALTDETFGDDSKLGALIVGITFLAMGLPVLVFVIWSKAQDWRDPAPDDRFQPSAPQPPAVPANPTMVPTSWPMAGGSSPPMAAAAPDPELVELEQLERLQRLRESGALTDAEFEQQKRRILDS